MYVPILKWRQGEYLALDQLHTNVKDKVIPLIEIPPIEWDFENNVEAKTIDKHLEPFSNRLHKKWKNRAAYLDFNFFDSKVTMKDGTHPLTYVFRNVRQINQQVIPVIGLNQNQAYQHAIKETVQIDSNGVCIRLKIRDIVKPNIELMVNSIVNYLEIEIQDVDLVIDLEAPNFKPLNQFVGAIRNAVKNLPQVELARSFTIASTNFPRSMGKLCTGVNLIDRLEWSFYLSYCSQFKSERRPRFGDYAIAHPELLSLDMRIITPSASLRYATDNAWWIFKGVNVRKNGLGQYKNICQRLVASAHFMGETYSIGDKYIADCSASAASTGNLTVWRRVGTNHHITKVVKDCATVRAF